MQCYLPVWDATFEGLTSVLLIMQVIDDVTWCHWVFSFWMLRKEHNVFIFMVKQCSFETSGITHSVTDHGLEHLNIQVWDSFIWMDRTFHGDWSQKLPEVHLLLSAIAECKPGSLYHDSGHQYHVKLWRNQIQSFSTRLHDVITHKTTI